MLSGGRLDDVVLGKYDVREANLPRPGGIQSTQLGIGKLHTFDSTHLAQLLLHPCLMMKDGKSWWPGTVKWRVQGSINSREKS
jgi:hypothetical protein